MKKSFELLPPKFTDTINYSKPITGKPINWNDNDGLPVGSLNDEEAHEYADFVKSSWLEYYQGQKEKYNDPNKLTSR